MDTNKSLDKAGQGSLRDDYTPDGTTFTREAKWAYGYGRLSWANTHAIVPPSLWQDDDNGASTEGWVSSRSASINGF